MRGWILVLVVVATLPARAGVFPDVPFCGWYIQAVEKLSSVGVLVGDENGRFNGKDPLTRDDFAVAMERYLDWVLRTQGGVPERAAQLDEDQRGLGGRLDEFAAASSAELRRLEPLLAAADQQQALSQADVAALGRLFGQQARTVSGGK